MPSELICFNQDCRARFPVTEVIYNCPTCGSLLEVNYPDRKLDIDQMRALEWDLCQAPRCWAMMNPSGTAS